jgi:hypothetical protein
MLIWSRWGILVVPVALLGLGTAMLVYAGLQGVGILEHSHQAESLFAGLGWMVGGAYTWLFDRYVLGRHLDKPRLYNLPYALERPYVYPDGSVQTHSVRPVTMQPRSTLFFVPVKYWSIVLIALGGVVFLVGVVRLAG